jgi:hypothetical protein
MKQLARTDSMMQLIRRTVWLLEISNGAGMNGLRRLRVLKKSSTLHVRTSRRL